MNTADTGGDNPDSFLAEAIVDDAVRRRRAENWSRHRATDDVTVLGTLAAGVGTQVAVAVATGEELQGVVTYAGGAVVVLDTPGATHWIRTSAVTAATPSTGRTAAGASVDSAVTGEVTDVPVESLLADLVDEQRAVEVRLVGGSAAIGNVRAVGSALVLDGADGRPVVVELAAVLSVRIPN